MTKFILKFATKGNYNFEDKAVREKVGTYASIVGLIINIFLSILKLIIGSLISSISVIADGFNNITDSASSIIALLGFKLSNKPPDKNHPYGHGRLEYIATFMVSILVVFVGFQFIQSSFNRILNPKVVKFDLVTLVLLLISVLLKLWLSYFNKDLGKKIDSSSLKAISVDAMGDVLTTSVVVFSIILSQFTSLPVDGIVGIIISLLIIYSGYSLIKDTISQLIGEAPSDELVNSIYNDILKYECITGAHDLFIHSYGNQFTMATIDVEFPGDIPVLKIHDIIDRAEREIGEKYNLDLVIHMDPLGPESKDDFQLRQDIKKSVKKDNMVKSLHDFTIFENENKTTVEFHLVVDGHKLDSHNTIDTIKESMEDKLNKEFKKYRFNIIVDIE